MASTAYCLKDKGDRELMSELRLVTERDCVQSASLLALIAEIDARRLYLNNAAPSMFVYLVEQLHYSEDVACKRTQAARTARRFPVLFELVARGQLHLTGINLLSPRLTEENHRELCAAACGRSKREIDQLLATRFPAPDVPTSLRKLPAPRHAVAPTQAAMAIPAPSQVQSKLSDAVKPSAVSTAPAAAVTTGAAQSQASTGRQRGLCSPLSPERYRLQLTLSSATRDKLLKACDLLGHRQHDGDLAAVIDVALTELCDRLERQKFGKTKRQKPASDEASPAAVTKRAEHAPAHTNEVAPPSTNAASQPKQPTSRHIPRAVRRAVAERDGYPCTFVSADARRCPARRGLEYHHIEPFARGGPPTIANTTLLCHHHNLQKALQDFGQQAVTRGIEATTRRRRGDDKPPCSRADKSRRDIGGMQQQRDAAMALCTPTARCLQLARSKPSPDRPGQKRPTKPPRHVCRAAGGLCLCPK